MEPPTRPRAITLAFEPFGWDELRAEADDAKIDVEALIQRAVAELVAELRATEARERLALEVPDAVRGAQAARAATLTVEISAEHLPALEQEAERQEVPVERLVEHAAFLYLARRDGDGKLA